MAERTERDQKIVALLKALTSNPESLDLLRTTLFETGHALMPRVEHMRLPAVTDPVRLSFARTGIVLDCETTGLDYKSDKLIQLSMLKILYDDQGIISIGDLFDEFQDPGFTIPEEIVELTGITDEDVRGKSIDLVGLRGFLADAKIVIAQNAEFDRKFVEASFPDAGFDETDWHCSVAQIDWKARGMSKANLEMLALKTGFVYGAHNAKSDILATAFVLAGPEAIAGQFAEDNPFAEMLRTAAQAPMHIIAQTSSFPGNATIDKLKANGYLWCPDDKTVCGYKKVWHKVIAGTEDARLAEAQSLRDIFGRDVVFPAFQYDPINRYSERAPRRVNDFCTMESPTAFDRLSLKEEGPVATPAQQSMGF